MIRRHVVSAPRNCRSHRLRWRPARPPAPAGGGPARGRCSTGAHEEPASSSERHAAAAGRRDHESLQRGSRCRVRSLPHMDEARRSEQRHGGRHQDREDSGARHDADDEREQREARRQHQETGRPDRARRVRDLSSRRGHSRNATATASASTRRCAGTSRSGDTAGEVTQARNCEDYFQAPTWAG